MYDLICKISNKIINKRERNQFPNLQFSAEDKSKLIESTVPDRKSISVIIATLRKTN